MQLVYHDEVLNFTKGNYEPITFHNISQLDDQNMLELTHVGYDTKPIIQCVQHGKKKSFLLHDIMMLCIHKNIKLKHHMNIFIGNPSMTMS